jgi:hypothetical protein
MSNNLTRKSLAFGALVALASSAIAGTPANAAGEVVFAPSTGTSYNTFLDATLKLNASLAPGQVAANITQLKYKIVSTAAADVEYKVNAGAFTATTAASQVVAGSGSATAANELSLKLGAAKVTAAATYSVVVTAFIDSNSNDVLDSGEFAQERTVTFKKYADVVPTVAITSAGLAGDTSVKATASYGDLNVEQLTATDLYVKFTSAGATVAGVNAVSGVYTDTVTALVAAGTVTAQAKYKTNLLGTAVSQTVTAQTVATVTAALVEGADAKVISATPTARLNTAFAVKATLRGAIPSGATEGPVVASKAVTAAVTGAGVLTTSRKLSINGTVYDGTTAIPASIALTSDANGVVTVNFLATGFADAETLTVTFTSENISTGASAVTVTQKKTAYAITADAGNLHSTPLGTPKAVAFSVKDQFGTLSAQTTDRLVVVPTVTSLTGYGTPVTAYLPVVGGKATYTASSGTATAAGSLSLATTLQTIDDATNNYVGYTTPVTGTAVVVKVTTTADSFTTAPAATATAKVNADAFTSAISTTAGYSATYTVVVANEGTAVTVAAPGAYVKVGATFGEGTATENTPAGGSVAVAVYFHTVGSQTVTFTNGVAVKTSVVTVTTDLAPAKVALVTPAQAQVGQALDVVINVTDKWDNVVPTPAFVSGANAGALVLSSTGTGYFASTAPVANAAGKATVKYIVGTADIGTAYLSATLDLATDVTAAKSIEFGLTDGDVVAGGRRVFVSAEFAKGRTVTVSIDGKRVYSKVQTTDNAVELAFTQKKAGVHTVTVRISGGIVFTEKVTTN